MAKRFGVIKGPDKIFDNWSLAENKTINELGVVETLLESLSVDTKSLVSTGVNDPPDCMLELDGVKVGIEVVAVMDQQARQMSVAARRDNRDEFTAIWNLQSFRAYLMKTTKIKEEKIVNGKMSKKAANSCGKFWLILHTDEFNLYSANVSEFIAEWVLPSEVFERIFLVLSYEPGRDDAGYPVFVLK